MKEGIENRMNIVVINDFIVNLFLNFYGFSIEFSVLNINREFFLVVFNVI